ncbi:MAG: uncharacterized protein KVP18_003482 [Porospora cf. gigantea A]|uniref:uncharacterized protein n=1 Tax=Porospora cf. gigantea A TaxID=2853593 RepID=UPI00355AA748|nr:MAG: hypothetical protein KVP18_003482 [Porospora cf. gigantea A]
MARKFPPPPHVPPPIPTGYNGFNADVRWQSAYMPPFRPPTGSWSMKNDLMAWNGVSLDDVHFVPNPPGHSQPLDDESSLAESSQESDNPDNVGGDSVNLVRVDFAHGSGKSSDIITPIEGCELHPIVIISDSAGRCFDDDDPSFENPINVNQMQITYQWQRGPPRAVCTFHPSRSAAIQCALTNRCYCDEGCYLLGFEQLRRFFRSQGKYQLPCRPGDERHNYGVVGETPASNALDAKVYDEKHLAELRTVGLLLSADEAERLWKDVSINRNYLPSWSDVGHQLRLQTEIIGYNNDRSVSFSSRKQVVTGCVVSQLPMCRPRPWLRVPPVDHHLRVYLHQDPSPNEQTYGLMSWNALAEIYATAEQYPYCDSAFLSWQYRKTRILATIATLTPDVVLLQEVQADHYRNYLLQEMARLGYSGLFKQKTREIFSGSGKKRGGKFTIDGCATFWNRKKFQLIEAYAVEFPASVQQNSSQLLPPELVQKPEVTKRLMKDNVALIALLETRPHIMEDAPDESVSKTLGRGIMQQRMLEGCTEPLLMACNTHILANTGANDVKIWQAHTLCSIVQEYACKTRARLDRRVPGTPSTPVSVIIGGDFNSTPESAVYELLTTGRVNKNHEDFKADRYGLLADVNLEHSLNLRSASAIVGITGVDYADQLRTTSAWFSAKPRPNSCKSPNPSYAVRIGGV